MQEEILEQIVRLSLHNKGPSVWPLRQRVRGTAVKNLSAFSIAVFLQTRAMDTQSLAMLHKLFINSPIFAMLLPSGVRSPDPDLAL